MKNILILILALHALCASSQKPSPTVTLVPLCSPNSEIPYAYHIDSDDVFGKFVGDWTFVSGNTIVRFKLDKIVKRYFPEYKVYLDFMVGNYSYSTDGGNTFVVNTIPLSINSDPELNPMFATCASNNEIKFTFKDVLLNKDFCTATFKFTTGSLTQMDIILSNRQGAHGYALGAVIPPYNFSIPSTMTVVKQ